MEFPPHPDDPQAISISRVHYPPGRYSHPASGLVQLRVVRGGSSYADIDLGAGRRHVFTRPGDVLVSLGDAPTFYGIEDGRDLTFVQASRRLVAELLAQLDARLADLEPLTVRPFRDPLLADLTGRIEEFGGAPSVVRRWALGVALALMVAAARRQSARGKTGRLTSRVLALVIAAIEARLEGTITVSELAGVANIPDRAFSEAFRDAAGMPVYQFVLQRRAERAEGLLRMTELPLAEVAQRSGFTHQAHMTRVLKRLKGVTPSRIRSKR
jgi:AraC family transcriptional regulator